MAIAGFGSYFAYDGLIAQAGNLSDGSLYVIGGTYEFAALDAGVNNGAGPSEISGRITLSAATATISDLFNQSASGNGFALFASIGRSYDANHAAYGRLLLTSGSDLTLIPEAVYQPGLGVLGGYDTLNVGIGNGGTGVVEILGTGSSLSTAGTNPVVRIGGAGGTGNLLISNGAEGRIFSLQAGFGVVGGTVANGDITVDGAGSRLLLSGSYGSYVNPAFSGFAGATTIGLAFDGPEGPTTGRGSLTITNGAEVVQQNVDGVTDFPLFRFGKDTLSSGTGLINGAGSRLAIIQNGPSGDDFSGGATLDIGEAGQGVVTVRNDGRIDVLGDLSLLSISRTPEAITPTDEVSSLTIESGGQVNVDAGSYAGGNVQVGGGPNARGELTVSGSGSRLSLASDAEGPAEGTNFGATLLIGREGQGTAQASDGATITIDGNDDRLPGVTIGTDGGVGSLSLTNATLTLQGTRTGAEAARITIGTDGGTGTLTLSSGALVENLASDGRVLIGATPGSDGTLQIADATLTNGGDVLVGAGISNAGTPEFSTGGTGRLLLTDGAVLNADNLIVGETGTVELTNSTVNSDVTLSGMVVLSPDEQSIETFNGTLTANGGSRIVAEVFDFQTGGSDQVIIQDPNSFRLADLPLSVDLKENVTFFGGDSFIFGTAPTAFMTETLQITDPANGRLFRLRAEGNDLSVDALFGTPVTLREDGTIGQIELPAIDRFLGDGSVLADQFDFEI